MLINDNGMPNILLKKHAPPYSGDFYEMIRDTPVIPAVKAHEEIGFCLGHKSPVVFVLYGDILTIPEVIKKIKNAGKTVLVHPDLVDGLKPRDIAIDFLAGIGADGILSAKTSLIKYAKEKGLLTVQRFFIMDSLSLTGAEQQFPLEYADAVQVLPGLMPKIIRRIAGISNRPLIAAGLITEKEEVSSALKAGAVSVSTFKAGQL